MSRRVLHHIFLPFASLTVGDSDHVYSNQQLISDLGPSFVSAYDPTVMGDDFPDLYSANSGFPSYTFVFGHQSMAFDPFANSFSLGFGELSSLDSDESC